MKYVLVKYNKKGTYTRHVKIYERKGIKYYLYRLLMKILGKEVDIIER